MAQDNLKEFTTQWIMFGFLFVSLLTFAILFTANNNPSAMDDSMSSQFNTTKNTINTKLNLLPSESNTVLNITSKTNPETSDLGSQDTVATGYKFHGTAKGFFDSAVSFFRLMFGGEAGGIILVVVSGLLGFLAVYFIVKWIRAGI